MSYEELMQRNDDSDLDRRPNKVKIEFDQPTIHYDEIHTVYNRFRFNVRLQILMELKKDMKIRVLYQSEKQSEEYLEVRTEWNLGTIRYNILKWKQWMDDYALSLCKWFGYPSSFTGGARYMMQNYLDAMSLCKWFGYPDLFITITCNPRWPEIRRFLKDTTLNPEDRPDILCRLFRLKLDALIKDIKEKSIFGKVQAAVYTIEFQKRGLPHAHICVFLHHDFKLPTPDHIDRVISAEIPDEKEDPELYALVKEFMIHGPCGDANKASPCMDKGKCKKKFPKKPRERTAHSRFRIPINITEVSMCNMKDRSDVGKLLEQTSLIVWDEAPMTNRHCFEALDRTLNDILLNEDSSNRTSFFGRKVVVFGGDFRQILPVVAGGTYQDIVNSSLSSSYIWNECKVLKLTKNMRLTQGSTSSDMERVKSFAKWLLQLGEGLLGGDNDGHADITIPDDLLIKDSLDPLQDLIEFVYPSILQNFKNAAYWRERAILAPTNEIVHEINDKLLAVIPGEEKEYLSSDSLAPDEDLLGSVDQCAFSSDVLNGLQLSGLPNHSLVLKIGVPVMLLRNLDQKNGLCNGTRMQIVTLGKRIIQAEVISGNNVGFRTLIPRITMSPSDKKIPFKFQRRQFPIAVCFGMTVNKSQGQSLSKVGLYLKNPCFSNGQLYVALSRVKTREGLKLLIYDDEGNVTNKTLNVVYKSVFSNL